MDKTNEAFEASSGDEHADEQIRKRRNVSSSTDETTMTLSKTSTDQEASSDELAGSPPADTQFKKNISYVTVTSSPKLQAVSLDEAKPEPAPGGGHFTISWRNLDYVVESKWYKLASQRKPILNDLSGSIESGQLTAILGPSGAGKSTLIDCLLGKRSRGLRGKTQVTFSDPELEQERRRRRPLKIATIPQEDHLLDTLTVMETFMYASKIKNAHLQFEEAEPGAPEKSGAPRRPFNHLANVQRVVQQLNLSSCAGLKCGKLSGGQYKRVSIGQELLSRPDIMILDEPTSGLDSVTCYQTINALRQLIDSSPYPMAIVATIHQPDVDVFGLFHKAYVLGAGGRAIYEGPTAGIFEAVHCGLDILETRATAGKAAQTSLAVEARGLSDNLRLLRRQLAEQRRINPARLIVELGANEYGYEITSVLNELQRRDCDQSKSASCLSLATSTSGAAPAAAGSAQALVPEAPAAPARPPPFDYEFHDPTRRRADLDKLLSLDLANMNQRRSLRVHAKHLALHTQRSWRTIVRDPMLFSVQVALHVLVPLLISYAFQGHRGEACPLVGPLDVVEEAYREGNLLEELNRELRVAFENLGYMFFQVYVIIFAAVCVTSLTYPLAMHVLLKEYRNGWYSLSSYFLGRTLADLPVPSFNVLLAMAISYHLTGQALSPYAWRFLSVAALTVLATLVAQTQGLMFGAMLMNAPQSAVFVAPASTAPLVVVSGFLIRIQSLPAPLQFLSKFSYFTHLLNGFVVSRYGFNRCPCAEADFALEEGRRVPAQARAIIDLWVDTFRQEYPEANATSTDLVGKLVDTITRAKTFGHEMSDCGQVKPFPMLDYQLEDGDLRLCFVALVLMLLLSRWLTYVVLAWKIRSAV